MDVRAVGAHQPAADDAGGGGVRRIGVGSSERPGRRARHEPKGPANPERSFGVSVGGVLFVIAAVLWWRGRVGRAEIVGAVGAVLLVFGLLAPRLLKWPSALWWRFSRGARLRQRARAADAAVLRWS